MVLAAVRPLDLGFPTTLLLLTLPESEEIYLSAQEIGDELERHGLDKNITRLRLVAHSRGILRLMRNTEDQRNLVSTRPMAPVLDVKAVERVISLDANHSHAPWTLLVKDREGKEDRSHIVPGTSAEGVLDRFPQCFFGFYAGTAGDYNVPANRMLTLTGPPQNALYVLASARIIQALPLLRAKWPYLAARKLDQKFADAVADMMLPPIGDISSHNFQTYFSQVLSALAAHKITSQAIIDHAAVLIDSGFLPHNWTLADFFHEIMDDAEPATDASLAAAMTGAGATAKP